MSERADWTSGREAILYQSCCSCGAAQYFRRAFCAACGGGAVTESRASELLDAANGRVKVAVVMERRALDAEHARALLEARGGSLRSAL